VGATTCQLAPVTAISARASAGNNGKNAQAFCSTRPSLPVGSTSGYPPSAISRYQEASHISPVYWV